MTNKDLPHVQVVARAAEALARSYADLCHYAEPSWEGMRDFGREVAYEAWKIMEIWGQQDFDYDSYKERERDMHGLAIDETSDGNETHLRSQATGVSARTPGAVSFKVPNFLPDRADSLRTKDPSSASMTRLVP